MSHGPDSALVFGPAYLDRVIRVDQPLLDRSTCPEPLDRSVDGVWSGLGFASAGLIHLVDPQGSSITLDPPAGWPGPVGTIAVARRFAAGAPVGPTPRTVRGVAWSADLGGMGAGFAASLGGTLVSALGPIDDPTSDVIVALLNQAGISHESARIADRPADWTLLFSSGVHGDKLAVGFRGCHASWTDLAPWADRRSRVRVVAALPNRVAATALGSAVPGQVRAFFPAARNMLDRADPMARFADRVDLLSCNRGEWHDLGDQGEHLDRIAVVAVTDGPRGASVRFALPGGGFDRIEVPAFPRSTPILDTNRAGEAFAATLLGTLVEAGWTPGPVAGSLVGRAAGRGSAAAALVLGRTDFGFPTAAEVDRAVERGQVG